jgi:hypothetical protein
MKQYPPTLLLAVGLVLGAASFSTLQSLWPEPPQHINAWWPDDKGRFVVRCDQCDSIGWKLKCKDNEILEMECLKCGHTRRPHD